MSPICVALLLLCPQEVCDIVDFLCVHPFQVNTDKGVEELDEVGEVLVDEAGGALAGVR